MRTNKYGNLKAGRYASKLEARRAQELILLQKSGKIRDLRQQVAFIVIPKQDRERAVRYIADFTYRQTQDGQFVVEDVKSAPTKTPAYVLKRKLMLLVYGIRVREYYEQTVRATA
ncbi:MAG: DUF1064 domain-containing protein [Nitrososphaera sp.]